MSSINPNNINGNYPVYGQDNPTQGFRDNFTNIKNNFALAKEEIEELQAKAILREPLEGETLDNDFNYSQITSAQLKSPTETFVALNDQYGNVFVDYSISTFQKISTISNANVTITNLPLVSAGAAKMKLWFNIGETYYANIGKYLAHTVKLNNVTYGANTIPGWDYSTSTIRFENPGDYVFELTTVDAGSNYLVTEVSSNKTEFLGEFVYYNPEYKKIVMLGFDKEQSNVILYSAGTSSENYSKVRANGAVSIYSITDNPSLNPPGIKFLAIRAANAAAPLQANSTIGYISSDAVTGTGSGNVVQQFFSIETQTSGSDYVNGLGANISFYTKRESEASNVYITTSFLADQSTKLYGNLILRSTQTPISSTAVGTVGQVAWDSDYIYICTATNTWKRANISTW
jgi:hypothetical protein